MANNIGYRFPGVNSFGKNDAAIFKGRDKDTQHLYTQVMLFKTLVLHSESGTGKSSIIQAGLIPLINKSDSNYTVIVLNLNDIAFDNKDSILTDYTTKKILEANPSVKKAGFRLYNHYVNSLWTIAKKLEKKDKKLLLIFDQFETLQSFNPKQVRLFKEELFKLLNSRIPADIYVEIQNNVLNKPGNTISDEISEADNEEYKFLSKPGTAKALFVIREDKLGTMSMLSDYFPDILKNDFILPSLNKENAYKAIVEPAIAEGNFLSMKFSFEKEDDLLELINIIADDQTGLVDPLQLQIVVSTIEKNVVIKHEKDKITKADIPKIGDIINDFYTACWKRVKDKLREKGVKPGVVEFNNRRKSIVERLIVNNRRNLVHSDLFISKENRLKDEALINELVYEGLIRKIPSRDDIYYQLCHDRFINPVNEDVLGFQLKEVARLEKLEAEKKDKEIADQKKYIIEIEKAQSIVTKALADKEEAYQSVTRYRKYVIAGSILVGIISVILFILGLRATQNAKIVQDLTRKDLSNNLISEATKAYDNGKHHIAFRKLQEAMNVQKSDRAEKLIDSLPFYEIAAKEIQNNKKDIVASLYTDNTASIWNLEDNRVLKIADIADVSEIKMSNTGKYIAYVTGSNTRLRILAIDNRKNIRLLKDSIAINENNEVNIRNPRNFLLDNRYSFSFSPKENYAFYRLKDFNGRLIRLNEKNHDDLEYNRLLQQIKPSPQDTLSWLEFSFDEKVAAIWKKKSRLTIFSLTENKILFTFPECDDFRFHDSLPIIYVTNFDKKFSRYSRKLLNYQNKKEFALKINNSMTTPSVVFDGNKVFFMDVFDDTLLSVVQLGASKFANIPISKEYSGSGNVYLPEGNYYSGELNVIAHFAKDSSYQLYSLQNTAKVSFKNVVAGKKDFIKLSDTATFWFFNGRDNIYTISKNDFSIKQRHGIKNVKSFIRWQNDSTIICTDLNNHLLLYNIISSKISPCQKDIESVIEEMGQYVRASIKIKEARSFSSEIQILIKPQQLNLKDKIAYFDHLYPPLLNSNVK